MANLSNVIKISEADFNRLVDAYPGSVDIGGTQRTWDPNAFYLVEAKKMYCHHIGAYLNGDYPYHYTAHAHITIISNRAERYDPTSLMEYFRTLKYTNPSSGNVVNVGICTSGAVYDDESEQEIAWITAIAPDVNNDSVFFTFLTHSNGTLVDHYCYFSLISNVLDVVIPLS